MKIVINESPLLSELVQTFLSYDDPDYPLDSRSGLSVALDRKVDRVLRAAMSEQRRFRDPTIEYFVNEIRRDFHLSHLLMLPWSEFKVLDQYGTIAMYMRSP